MTTVRRPSPRLIPWATTLLIVLAVLVVAPASSRTAGPEAYRAKLEILAARIDAIESELAIMELSAARFEEWMACTSMVPVSEFGDADHSFGYAYDERDGTGLDHRPALAVDDGAEAQYQFLRFDNREECQSDTTKPGTPGSPGTADPALRAEQPTDEPTLADLEHRLSAASARAEQLERMSELFDEWESCLSSVGVTEYGDPDGQFGYVFDKGGGSSTYAAALSIDVSEWDDPDYFFLTFVGSDRPFEGRECGHEPGEEVD